MVHDEEVVLALLQLLIKKTPKKTKTLLQCWIIMQDKEHILKTYLQHMQVQMWTTVRIFLLLCFFLMSNVVIKEWGRNRIWYWKVYGQQHWTDFTSVKVTQEKVTFLLLGHTGAPRPKPWIFRLFQIYSLSFLKYARCIYFLILFLNILHIVILLDLLLWIQ